MPNYSVFNFDPDRLRSKIFGSEDVPIKTDSDGLLEIANISDPVTVTATNLDIRDLTEARDSILIFGFDGDENVAIRTDSDGRLEIASISDPVTVTATNLDIRDLTEARDSILIFGFDGDENVAIKTDSDGLLEIRSISDPISAFTVPDFDEETFDVTTGNDFAGLDYVDTSTQTMYTFFVHNTGANSADVRLDVSADEIQHFVDVSPRVIAAGETDVFVPNTFLRYTRLSYKSTEEDSATTLDIFFQTQSS